MRRFHHRVISAADLEYLQTNHVGIVRLLQGYRVATESEPPNLTLADLGLSSVATPALLTFEAYSAAGYVPEGPPPTLEQYVAAGYHAEGYQAFVDAYIEAHAESPMPED